MNIIEILKASNQDEAHLARLLILINILTEKGEKPIKGITKLVKLDFLLRYPNFLKRAITKITTQTNYESNIFEYENIESHMIRFLYGPWDAKYRSYLNVLYAQNLVKIYRDKNATNINITNNGVDLAIKLIEIDTFSLLVQRSQLIKKYFDKSGTWLKGFIYKHFPEIKNMEYGEVIVE